MNTFSRVALWFGSVILSVAVFSVLLSRGTGVLFIFRVALMFALPVWCLYLPFVFALKDAEGRRIWIILVSGVLIGPASLALLGLVQQLRGGDPQKIWQGDPLIGGTPLLMISASVVGFLTTAFYAIALKALHRRSNAATSSRT
jgi:hypothetical protein